MSGFIEHDKTLALPGIVRTARKQRETLETFVPKGYTARAYCRRQTHPLYLVKFRLYRRLFLEHMPCLVDRRPL